MDSAKEKIFIVIPAYNEEKNIGKTLQRLMKYKNGYQIVVVNDGSKDGTFKEASKFDIAVIQHMINLGKGKAIKSGCQYAMNQGATKIVLMDSDLQHKPSDIKRFIKKLERYDFIIGMRDFNETAPLRLRIGNFVIARITDYLYGLNLFDATCGFRAFKTSIYKQIEWSSAGYFCESEMNIHIGNKKIKYDTVIIQTIYLDGYKGTDILDGISIVMKLLLYKIKGDTNG
jgi:glycosyltransferase involved in cell wall biosynthesis